MAAAFPSFTFHSCLADGMHRVLVVFGPAGAGTGMRYDPAPAINFALCVYEAYCQCTVAPWLCVRPGSAALEAVRAALRGSKPSINLSLPSVLTGKGEQAYALRTSLPKFPVLSAESMRSPPQVQGAHHVGGAGSSAASRWHGRWHCVL